ncbi:MAG: AAA family ATPase [Gammaproteobacteria bacterium]|nr:AAA family ATPase [Gammaproteobacteria bacterium]
MTFDIATMLNPEVYNHPVRNIELIETHISWVILTGDFVYKLKKPVDFGFLNFSTLEKRHHFCKQELRLNRRLAPAIYLEVVSISGTVEQPRIAGRGEAFEYAVKMAQFPQSAQLDQRLAAGELEAEHIDAIAQMVAEFHQHIDIADDAMDYGDNAVIYQPVSENFCQIREHLDTTPYTDALIALETWSECAFDKLKPVLRQRKQDGFVRECHGDMHLRNMVWLESGPTAFDCIEFNAHLRWIDVISEVAFLIMDLQARQQPPLASRFLNRYLEITGDYAGLGVLPFYLCYRAMVRAKVAALRHSQENIKADEKQNTLEDFELYLRLAGSYTQPASPKLIIMRGMSASGKSTVSQQLLDTMGLIRIRSDVERKRLFAVPLSESTLTKQEPDKIDAGIYSPQATQQTYAKLAELASQVIAAGYSVIVDAAFLKKEQREPFQHLARQAGVSYTVLEITAPLELLRQRISEREHDISDADLSVLEHQISHWQPLSDDEKSSAIAVNTAEKLNLKSLIEVINSHRGKHGQL